LLRQDESWSDVVAALERCAGGAALTVREGLRPSPKSPTSPHQLKNPRDSFLAAAEDSVLLVNLGLPPEAPSAEGYLFPTTTCCRSGIGVGKLVRVMAHQFTQHGARSAGAARYPALLAARLVTLASIIEAEVRYDPTGVRLAVYHNR